MQRAIPPTTQFCPVRPIIRFALALPLLVAVLSPASSTANSPTENSPVPKKPVLSDFMPAMTMQQVEDTTAEQPAVSTGGSSPIQGSLSKIQITRGRSQIVRFAQPVARLSIADPAMADIIPLAPDQIMINGKQRGTTSLIVWDENGQEGIFDLSVRNDSTEVMEAVQAIAPNEKVQARVTDDSFILTGQVENAVLLDEIKKTAAAYGYKDDRFVDLTDTPVPQVMLDVRMAEANRSVGRALKTSFNGGGNTLQMTRLGNVIDSGIANKIPVVVNGQTIVGKTSSGILPPNIANTMSASNVGGLTGAYQRNGFTALWDVLETTGKLNTLANPNLLCTHGRTASFLAGGEFPFVGAVDQNGSPIIQFKEFGVKLNFTPWIALNSNRIELKVQPEVSNLDTSSCITGGAGSQVCGILKRTTDTTVQLVDGESLMISGILSRDEQNQFAKVPFISNVPILGALFKNSNTSKTDRELVVIITPHIVHKPSVASSMSAGP